VIWVLFTAKIPGWALTSIVVVLAIGLLLFVAALLLARRAHRDALEGLGPARQLLARARLGLAVMRSPVAAGTAAAFQSVGWACQLLAVWATMFAFHIHTALSTAGLVLVLIHGHLVPLTQLQQIPAGVAIDSLHGPVIRLVLAADGWETHPRRLGVDGRVLRLGYFASQPASLLTALCANGDRVDLLVVAPGTAEATAEAAMTLAATAGNLVHAPHILAAVNPPTPAPEGIDATAEAAWDAEGGQPAPAPRLARIR